MSTIICVSLPVILLSYLGPFKDSRSRAINGPYHHHHHHPHHCCCQPSNTNNSLDAHRLRLILSQYPPLRVLFCFFRRGRSSVSPPWTPDAAAWGRKTLNMADTEYKWQGNVNNDFLVFCGPVIPQLGLDLQCGGGGGGDTFHVSPWHFSYTRPLDFTI